MSPSYHLLLALLLSQFLPATISQASPAGVLPSLAVANITVSNSDPLEGDLIKITAVLVSNESRPLDGITVHFFIDQREIGNMSQVAIDAMGTTRVSINWTAEKWEHIVAVSLDMKGTSLPAGLGSIPISVRANPIGDTATLVYALSVVVLTVFLIAVAPSVRAAILGSRCTREP